MKAGTRARARQREFSGQSDGDPVEAALAKALAEASAAGRWDVVAQLAAELQARRAATPGGNVVALASRRAKRK